MLKEDKLEIFGRTFTACETYCHKTAEAEYSDCKINKLLKGKKNV